MEGRSISGSTMVAVLLLSLTMGVFGAERVNKSAAVGSWSPEADEDLGDRTVQEEERHLDGGFSSLDGMLQWAIGTSSHLCSDLYPFSVTTGLLWTFSLSQSRICLLKPTSILSDVLVLPCDWVSKKL